MQVQEADDEIQRPSLLKQAAKVLLWLVVILIVAKIAASPFFGFYKIPAQGSGGTYPTLLGGDFILVDKSYKEPHRGDLMAFQYDDDVSSGRISIARVAGVGGDTVEYVSRHLLINHIEQPQEAAGEFIYVENMNFVRTKRYVEDLGGNQHAVLLMPERPSFRPERVNSFAGRESCMFNDSGMSCNIPNSQYFMIGDNRDDSLHSRHRGFVPKRQIIGKITTVWINFHDKQRIGLSVK